MSELANTLRDRRLECWEQAKGIAERAAEEKRSMTGEEERQWDQYTSEMDALDKRLQDVITGEQRAKDAADAMDRLSGKPVEKRPNTPAPAQQGSDGADLDTELRNWILHKNPAPYIDLGGQEWIGAHRWTDKEYRSVHGHRGSVEYRSLLDSNTPLPTSFVGQLYSYLVDTSTIRQANPRVFTTQSGDQLVVPVSTAEGSAHWTAEGAALSAGDPTFGSKTLYAHKIGQLIQISQELLEDEGFDVVGFLAEAAGRNLGIATNTSYIAGTGTTQPTGLLTTATVALTAATGTGSTTGLPTTGAYIAGDVLVALYHSIIPQYRPRASWLMNDQTIMQVRRVKDTIGQYIWQPGLQAGEPDRILGRPVYADPAMPLISASSTPIAFGDIGGYFIRDVSPIRFERSNDFAFNTDVITFRAVMRTDGIQGDLNAIALYQTATS